MALGCRSSRYGVVPTFASAESVWLCGITVCSGKNEQVGSFRQTAWPRLAVYWVALMAFQMLVGCTASSDWDTAPAPAAKGTVRPVPPQQKTKPTGPRVLTDIPWTATADPKGNSSDAPLAIGRWNIVVKDGPPAFLAGGPENVMVIWLKRLSVLQCYDVRDGSKLHEIGDFPRDTETCEVSWDGRFVVGVRTEGTRYVVGVWSLETGAQAHEIKLPDGKLLATCCTPGGQVLLAISGNDGVELSARNLSDGAETWAFTLETKLPQVAHLAMETSPGGRYCSVIAGNRLQIVELGSSTCVGQLDIPVPAMMTAGIAFSDDGSRLGALFRSGGAYNFCTWDMASGNLVRATRDIKLHLSPAAQAERNAQAQPVLWLGDGKWLLCRQVIVDGARGETVAPIPRESMLARDYSEDTPVGLLDAEHLISMRRQNREHWDLAVRPWPESGTLASSTPNPSDDAQWNVAVDPAAARLEVSPDLNVTIPDGSGRLAYPARPSPHVAMIGRDALSVYDLRSGDHTGTASMDTRTSASRIDVSPDGCFVARYGLKLEVLSVQSGQEQTVSTGRWPPLLIEFIGPSELLVVEPTDKRGRVSNCKMTVWSFPEQRKVCEFTSNGEQRIWEDSLSVSPGGRYLVALQGPPANPLLQVYETRTGTVVGQMRLVDEGLQEIVEQTHGIAFLPDGSELAILYAVGDGSGVKMRTFDFATGETVFQADLGDSSQLVASDPLQTSLHLRSITCTVDGQNWFVFDRHLVDRGAGRIVTTLPPLNQRDRRLIDRGRVLVLARLADRPGSVLGVLDLGGDLAAQEQQLLAALIPADEMTPSSTAGPSDSSPMAQTPTGAQAKANQEPRSLKPKLNWDVQPDPPALSLELNRLQQWAIPISDRADIVHPARPSPYMAICEEDSAGARLVDLRTGKEPASLRADLDKASQFSLSPDGRYLAAELSEDGENAVHVWSFVDGQRVTRIGAEQGVRAGPVVRFGGVHQLVVVSTRSGDCNAMVWDLQQSQLVHRIRLPDVKHVDISPGGIYLATLRDRSLLIYDLKTGQRAGQSYVPIPVQQNLHVHSRGLRFSPDGTELAAFCMASNHHLVCWDVATGGILLHRRYSRFLSSSNEPLIRWLPDKLGWLHGGLTLIERRTGAAVWQLKDKLRESDRLLGLNAYLEWHVTGEMTVTALPGKQLEQALNVARTAPSEKEPPLTAVDVSTLALAGANGAPDEWAYEPDSVQSDGRQRHVTVTCDRTYEAIRSRGFHSAGPGSGLVAIQKLVESRLFTNDPPSGPKRAERWTRVGLYDAFQDKLLGEMDITGRCEPLDISPDGSLVLTGSAWRYQLTPYDRLDVWAPGLQQHAVGWRPHVNDPADQSNLVRWARFIDKRHVLTWCTNGLVLWELPACRAIYEVSHSGVPVALSPTREYVVTRPRANLVKLYDTTTGRYLGILQAPTEGIHESEPIGCFSPDGQRLLMLGAAHSHRRVVVWDMNTGKIRQEFGVPPQVAGLAAQFTDERSVVITDATGFVFLVNLDNQAVVGYRAGGARAQLARATGGVVWSWQRPGSDNDPRRVVGEPIVAEAGVGPRLEDHAAVYPGMHVAVDVASSFLDRRAIQQDLANTLKEKGFVPDTKARRRFVLNLSEAAPSDVRKLSNGGQLALRSMKFHLKLTGDSGEVLWEIRRTVPQATIVVSDDNTDTAAVTQQALRNRIRQLAASLLIPRYIVPDLDELNIQTIALPGEAGPLR